MILNPCNFCGHHTKEDKDPQSTQRYARVVCEKCGGCGPMGKSELLAWQAWNSNKNYIPVPPDPSKCVDCGWDGDNSLIKDARENGQTIHWTCPQCNNKRVTLGMPVNKIWS